MAESKPGLWIEVDGEKLTNMSKLVHPLTTLVAVTVYEPAEFTVAGFCCIY